LIQKQKKRNHNLSAASQNETKQKVLPGKTGNKTKQAKTKSRSSSRNLDRSNSRHNSAPKNKITSHHTNPVVSKILPQT
jgi:hypothetical protein